jgi:chromosome segregation ATPase
MSKRRTSLIPKTISEKKQLVNVDGEGYLCRGRERMYSFANLFEEHTGRKSSLDVKRSINVTRVNDPAFTYLMEISKEVKMLKSQNSILMKQYDKVQNESTKKDNAQEVQEELKEELEKLNYHKTEEEEKYESVCIKFSELKKATEEMINKKLKVLRQDLFNINEQIKEAEGSSVELESAFATLKKKKKILEDKNRAMGIMIDNYKNEVTKQDLFEEELKKVNKQLESKSAKVKVLSEQARDLQKINTALQLEADELRSKMKSKETRIRNLTSKQIDYTQEIEHNKKIKLLLTKQNEVLVSLLENAKESANKLGLVSKGVRKEIIEDCKEFITLYKKELKQVEDDITIAEEQQVKCSNKIKEIASVMDERR